MIAFAQNNDNERMKSRALTLGDSFGLFHMHEFSVYTDFLPSM